MIDKNKIMKAIMIFVICVLIILFTTGYISKNLEIKTQNITDKIIEIQNENLKISNVISIASYTSCIRHINQTNKDECYKNMIVNVTSKFNEEIYKEVTYYKYWLRSMNIFDRQSSNVISCCLKCSLEISNKIDCVSNLNDLISKFNIDYLKDKLIYNWISNITISKVFNLNTYNDMIELNKNTCIMTLITIYYQLAGSEVEVNQLESIQNLIEYFITPSEQVKYFVLFANRMYTHFYKNIFKYIKHLNNVNTIRNVISKNFDYYCNITGKLVLKNDTDINREDDTEDVTNCRYWMSIFTILTEEITKTSLISNHRKDVINLIENIDSLYYYAKLKTTENELENSRYDNCDIFNCELMLQAIQNFINADTEYNYMNIYNNLTNNLKLYLYYNMKYHRYDFNFIEESIKNLTTITNNSIPIDIKFKSNTTFIYINTNFTGIDHLQKIKIKLNTDNECNDETIYSIIKIILKEIITIYNITFDTDIEIEYILLNDKHSKHRRLLGFTNTAGIWVPYENRVYIYNFECENETIKIETLETLIHESVHVIQEYINRKENTIGIRRRSYRESYAVFISSIMTYGLQHSLNHLIKISPLLDYNTFDIYTSFTKQITSEIDIYNWYYHNPLFLSYLYICKRNEFVKVHIYTQQEFKNMENEFKKFIKFRIYNTDILNDTGNKNYFNMTIDKLKTKFKKIKCTNF